VYTIGLTGGISSGKSTVSAMLYELGAVIVDTDKIAREIVEPGQPAWHEIVAAFGETFLLPDGYLNRKLLGEMIFSDDSKRRQLERITHPYIQKAAQEALYDACRNGAAVAVLDVPLLIEVGWQNMVQAVWVVYVDAQTQVNRLMERDQLTRDQALARIGSQMNLQDKLPYAKVVIDNSNSLEATKKQVLTAWRRTCVLADS